MRPLMTLRSGSGGEDASDDGDEIGDELSGTVNVPSGLPRPCLRLREVACCGGEAWNGKLRGVFLMEERRGLATVFGE